MPLGTPAPLNKRKKLSKIITDLTHVAQDEPLEDTEAQELDLGKKIRTPKDIMLEELSLASNKGSKMFRMRQKRVEKFIYENNPDIFSNESMDNLQKFVLGGEMGNQIGGQFINLGGHCVSKLTGPLAYAGMQLGGAPVPPPKPGSKGAGAGGEGGEGGVGGAGGEGRGDRSGLKGKADAKKQFLVKTYVSPWEKAMKGDENLLATLKTGMAAPSEKLALAKFKSFNRFAMPFGGFDKANQLLKFQLPETETVKEEPEPTIYQHDIGCRPSFNRTPIGWVCSGDPCSIQMESDAVPFDGETDEL